MAPRPLTLRNRAADTRVLDAVTVRWGIHLKGDMPRKSGNALDRAWASS